LTSIDDVSLEQLRLSFHSVPTDQVEDKKFQAAKGSRLTSVGKKSSGHKIESLADLRKIDVTLWVLSDSTDDVPSGATPS
jgi:hypothetical protein